MIVNIHPHTKIYSLLWSMGGAMACSLAVVLWMGSLFPNHSFLLGLLQAILFFWLAINIFNFLFSHCVDTLHLKNNGFLVETLGDQELFVPFNQVTMFHAYKLGQGVLFRWSWMDGHRQREQFLLTSLAHMDPLVIENMNIYFLSHLPASALKR